MRGSNCLRTTQETEIKLFLDQLHCCCVIIGACRSVRALPRTTSFPTTFEIPRKCIAIKSAVQLSVPFRSVPWMSVARPLIPLVAGRPGLARWQGGWTRASTVAALDVLWNAVFALTTAAVLASSRAEAPRTPLRLWAAGYALQCVLHIASVVVEHSGGRGSLEEDADEDGQSSLAKHLESASTTFSFIWWILGFYVVSMGGQSLTQDAPQLYWLCIVFLAFDIFFVVFCAALACIVGIAVCCCLPCIVAILCAVTTDQEAASDEDIVQLPKYKFSTFAHGGVMTECGTDEAIHNTLSADDAECCICLCSYDDGVELRELPCSHHFHRGCIDKWLHISATCPLCKHRIVLQSHQDGMHEV